MTDQQQHCINPLKTWLKSTRTRYGVFGQKVARSEGCIARWCSGERHPSPADQEKIRLCTAGAVRPEDWHAYRIGLEAPGIAA